MPCSLTPRWPCWATKPGWTTEIHKKAFFQPGVGFLPNSRSGGCSAGCPDPPYPSPRLCQLFLMGSGELIPYVPSQPYQRGFLHRGWREGNPSCQQLPALTQPHWLLLEAGTTLSFSPSWFLHGAGPCLQLHHPNIQIPGQWGDPQASEGSTRATAHVGISALNDNLVFCCVFLRDCMPDQTAFLGLHPIFIL